MRGTPGGETPVSKANSEEFRSGYDRTFGNSKPQRGRWVYDAAQGKLVSVDEYVPQTRALDAPIMVDRFMEGASTIDGQDIGSRAKRREYMRRNGVADASDVSSKWVQGRREEKERRASEITRKTVAELSNVDTRNLRNAVEQMRSKK
jgi:hypothetical protein